MRSIQTNSSARNKPFRRGMQLLSANTLLAVFLLGCTAPQNTNAGDKTVSPKKSSTPVKVQTRTDLGINKRKAKSMKKMNKQEQELYAREDLAKRLNLKMEQTTVSGAIQVTWRSGALGCPQPGMNYTQALVPGVLIMVKAGNTPYRYHASPGGEPFYCPDSQAESQYLNSSDI